MITALGDTQRPINEITLWDLSASVAAFYKSAVAKVILEGKWRDRNDLRWRLLRVNFDVLGLYAKAVKIADLLAYQDAVDKACAAVKQLVEVTYPLGNEVYRDTTGIYFTYPDLDLFPELEQKIRQRVEGVDSELAPRIAVEQSSRATAVKQLKRLLADARDKARQDLAQPFAPENLSTRWTAQWENLPKGRWEVCPVCRLRPMQEGQEACATCLQRRKSRVTTWLANPQQTIWMDERADCNDRVALIVGKFGLDDWLSGDLVQTMLVKAMENNPGECKPKNPSPARLRRVWETCQRFWTETVNKVLANISGGSRLIVIPNDKTYWQKNVPYDGTVKGKAVSLLWCEQARHFITISNLQWVDDVIEDGQEIVVSEPDAPDRSRRFTVQGVMPAMGGMAHYAPYLTLLESPDQFLALVPAAAAPQILTQIRNEYVKQFGKVQNRLPLFLGAVFFPRKTPLAAVLDTGRRMAHVQMANSAWQITEATDNDGQNVTLELENVNLKERIKYQVPIVMGDKTTADVWYPYFELASALDTARHTHRFERDGVWWVHVKNLQVGDTVRVTPSRFAYLFLESTAQRFRFDPIKDIHYLDELPRLTKMWDDLIQVGITKTSLYGIATLLAAKAAAWGATSPELKQLAATTLQQAKLFKRQDKDGKP
ncbi:MAG: hypothetical protein U9R05_08770, partial [Chloroflexota bacterium]|nr:hypothetical protein [Chloroflexota bacterium]